MCVNTVTDLARALREGKEGLEPIIHDALLDIGMEITAEHFNPNNDHHYTSSHITGSSGCIVCACLLGEKSAYYFSETAPFRNELAEFQKQVYGKVIDE